MNEIASTLKRKIKNKKAHIAVIGLGYVGLPLACEFAKKGFQVTGIDIDQPRIRALRKGESYIDDIPSKELKRLIKKGNLSASSDYESLGKNVDIVIICVPTPLNRVKDPDISFIVNAAQEIQKRLHAGELVILESTTYPGTTEEVILPSLEKSDLRIGKDFFLCFSPERIDPGNPLFKTHNIPKVVGGITPVCTELAELLYGQITNHVVAVSSSRTAEMTKLLENTFRIVNIGLINELARAAESLQVNIWEAVDAAKTKPFGYMPFYPGPGIGGHCIGVDPIYLSWKARVQGTDLHFIELARRINAEMPRYVASKAVYALNQHLGKAISRSRVMMLGITYKKDVCDTRESPALDIMQELMKLGARVCYHDPFVPFLENQTLRMKSQALDAKNLKRQDLVILTTNHSKFDYKLIAKYGRLIFDTRNVFRQFQQPNIVRL
ncbi:MAG TPA: nucleotide sugar dehydrogenase [bacterium]|nr:nucleotide sugar dehydrogenase [bacterium]